jgi:predicted HicB family RNase H-like nuclease
MKVKKLPRFQSIEEEAAFWDTHSFADYLHEFEEVEEPVFVKPRKLGVSVPSGVKARLRAIAKKKNRSLNYVALEAILQYLKREERKLRRKSYSSL